MLNFLRKKGNIKKIMWGLAALIVPAFVLWGSGSSIRSRDDLPKHAGEIFGKKVSFRQYETAWQAARNQLLLIYGDNFKKIAQYLDLDKEAWERLILLYQVKAERIKVGNEEVIGFIERHPFFQEDGRFNQGRYKVILDYSFRISPRDFEEQVREMLAIGKLREQLFNVIEVSDQEIEQAYKQENEQAKAAYVFVDPDEFKAQVQPGYEQLQTYYENQKEEFRKLEQVNVDYAGLYFDQAQVDIEIGEPEVQEYYQKNQDQFSAEGEQDQPITRPLAEVSSEIKEKLTAIKTRETLEDQIWQLSDDIGEEPGSFAAAVEKNQLELKETGFFGPQQVIPEVGLSYEFLNTAFALKIGEISNVLETPKGFFIIKVKAKKESQVPPLEEIKAEVEKAVVRQESWQLAQKRSEELLTRLKDLMQKDKLGFDRAAEKLSLTVTNSEGFTRSSYISGIGQSPEFAAAAFALKTGEVSPVVRVPNGYCILSPQEIIPVDQEKFVEEKEQFGQQLLGRKKEQTFADWLDQLKQRASLVNNITKLKEQKSP
ncbi:peptidyl-prolyl cis-trans isomerase [Candidatus Omnitrophota bacterium]